MFVFKIIYLGLTFVVTFAIVRALTENWKNYAKSQRCYLLGFFVILAAMTQGAAAQITNEVDFTYRTGIIMVGLLIVIYGMRYGADPRLRERQLAWEHPEEFNHYLDLLAETRELEARLDREENDSS